MFGESAGGEVVIGVELPVVRRVDDDHVTVGCEQMPTADISDVVGGLTLQRCLDLLRNDVPAECSGEDVTDGAL